MFKSCSVEPSLGFELKRSAIQIKPRFLSTLITSLFKRYRHSPLIERKRRQLKGSSEAEVHAFLPLNQCDFYGDKNVWLCLQCHAKSSCKFYVLLLFTQVTELQEFNSQLSYSLCERRPKLHQCWKHREQLLCIHLLQTPFSMVLCLKTPLGLVQLSSGNLTRVRENNTSNNSWWHFPSHSRLC